MATGHYPDGAIAFVMLKAVALSNLQFHEGIWMPWRILGMPLYNMLEGIVDACRDSVQPEIGSVVYCDLAFGYMDHSGIYVGNGRIAHLAGTGRIELVTPKKFIDGCTAVSIYVSCNEGAAVGCASVARRAMSMVGQRRSYNFLLDNCHQFTSGCLSGNFENSSNFLWMMKDDAKKRLRVNNWRFWDIDLFS